MSHMSYNNYDRIKTIRPRDQRVIKIYKQEYLKLSDHFVKFGGRSHSGCRDLCFSFFTSPSKPLDQSVI